MCLQLIYLTLFTAWIDPCKVLVLQSLITLQKSTLNRFHEKLILWKIHHLSFWFQLWASKIAWAPTPQLCLLRRNINRRSGIACKNFRGSVPPYFSVLFCTYYFMPHKLANQRILHFCYSSKWNKEQTKPDYSQLK